MKKLVYILSILTVIALFNSCTKEDFYTCGEHDDPFTQENFDDDSETRGTLTGPGGGIVDPDTDDDDLDDEGDDIVDPDTDDDDMDDDDEALDDRVDDTDED